jgi:hypothetical protein
VTYGIRLRRPPLTVATANPVQTLKGNERMGSDCTVRVFRQKFTLKDAIEFHDFAPLEAQTGV